MADLDADDALDRAEDLRDLSVAAERLARARSGASRSHTLEEVELRLGLLE